MDFRALAIESGGVIIIMLLLSLLLASDTSSAYGPLASPSASAASNITVVDLVTVDRGEET